MTEDMEKIIVKNFFFSKSHVDHLEDLEIVYQIQYSSLYRVKAKTWCDIMVPLMFSSHLHCPLKLRFLECPPDLTGNEEYVDEAAMFFSNPLQWLRKSFPSQSTLPSHIVLFDSLEKVKDRTQWNAVKHIQHKCCRTCLLLEM